MVGRTTAIDNIKLFKDTYTFVIWSHGDYEKYTNCQLNVTQLVIKALHDDIKIDFKRFWRMLEILDTLQVKFFGNSLQNIGSLMTETHPFLIALDIDFFNIIDNQDRLSLIHTIISMPKLKSLRISLASINGTEDMLSCIPIKSKIKNLEFHGFHYSSKGITTFLEMSPEIERLKITCANKLNPISKDRIHGAILRYLKQIQAFDITHNPKIDIQTTEL